MKYTNRKNTSTKSTPKDASLEKNEDSVYQNLMDKTKKKTKKKLGVLVRTADKKLKISRGDTTNWS